MMELYADAQALTVNIPGPHFSVARHRPPGLASLFGSFVDSEFRSAVPIRSPEGSLLRLGEVQGTETEGLQDSCLFVATDPKEAGKIAPVEMEEGLLNSQPLRKPPWRRQRERLGMLLWMDRRVAVYENLKLQIKGAQSNGVVQDGQGLMLLDLGGEPLSDLYQYCIYQFRERPWDPERVSSI